MNGWLTASDKRWLLGALGVGVAGLLVVGPIGAIVGSVGTLWIHKAIRAPAFAAANAAAEKQMALDRARAAAQKK